MSEVIFLFLHAIQWMHKRFIQRFEFISKIHLKNNFDPFPAISGRFKKDRIVQYHLIKSLRIFKNNNKIINLFRLWGETRERINLADGKEAWLAGGPVSS
jgi:hypothetical protein